VNSILLRKLLRRGFILASVSIAWSLRCAAQTDVLTWHNDVARTGQNLTESLLTTANVNATTFGLLANVAVDGKVDAQPLYVSASRVNGQGAHNILFIATEHDSVYAVDADTGKVYWQKSLLLSGETTSDARGCDQVIPEIGITATPVIDRNAGANGTIFLTAMSKNAAGTYYQRIHALDLSSGGEQSGGPVVVQATYPGTGDNSSNGSVVFDAKQYKGRPALMMLNGLLYTSWGSHCDIRPYTGWMIAYNESTLKQVAVLNYTPNGSDAAPWNAGAGPAADASGNVYVALGNGTFDTTLTAQGFPGKSDYGNSMVKMNGSTLSVLDYWTMYNSTSESNGDVDLGSGGLMVLPDQRDSTGKVRHLVVAAGKDRNLYVADRDNMGHYDATNDGTIYQQLSGALPGGVWSSPAYFNERVYYGSVASNMRSFPLSAAQLNGNSIQTTSTVFAYPGTTPSISANGTANAIVWATENTNPAVLHAYAAGNLTTELYNSNQAASSRDHFGIGNKFIAPTIANGKVYVGTTNSVAIFGFIRQKAAPVADGDHVLLNLYSQLVLDDPGWSTASGIAIYEWPANGRLNQEWFLSYNGNGYYTIQNVASRLFLTDANGATTEGISLEQAEPTHDDSQLWSLTATGTGYLIRNKASGLVVDDKGWSKSSGPNVILWLQDGGSNQTWVLE
jgi:hypothetical protein